MLLQAEQMFGPIVSGEGSGNLRLGGVAPPVAMPREGEGVGLARDDVPENAHPRASRDIGDHERQLEVHLHERFLHPLDLGARPLHESGAVAKVGTEDHDGIRRPKAPAQQAHEMEISNPLAVRHIALPARYVLDVAGIHEADLQASGLQDLEDWDPVNARGFHGDARHATRLEPVG